MGSGSIILAATERLLGAKGGLICLLPAVKILAKYQIPKKTHTKCLAKWYILFFEKGVILLSYAVNRLNILLK